MLHQPCTELFRHNRLTRNGYFASPLMVDPDAELTGMSGEGQVDEFDFEVRAGFMIPNGHAVERLGSGHAPL